MEDPETLWGMKRPVDTGKCSARTLLACFTVFYLSLSLFFSPSLSQREEEKFFCLFGSGGGWWGYPEAGIWRASPVLKAANRETRNRERKKKKKRKEKWIKISERKNKRLEWPLAFLRVAKWLIKGKG